MFCQVSFQFLKKTLMPDRFNKSFSFSINSSLFKKVDEVWHFVSPRAPVNNFVSDVNLSE